MRGAGAMPSESSRCNGDFGGCGRLRPLATYSPCLDVRARVLALSETHIAAWSGRARAPPDGVRPRRVREREFRGTLTTTHACPYLANTRTFGSRLGSRCST